MRRRLPHVRHPMQNPARDAMGGPVLSLDPPPVITTAVLPDADEGVAYSEDIETTGPVTSLSMTGGILPDGLVFVDNGNGTATISGTPTEDGTFSLTVTATGPGGSDEAELTLTVNALPAPTWAEIWNGAAHIYDLDPSRVTLVTTGTAWEAGTFNAGSVRTHAGKVWQANSTTSAEPGTDGDWDELAGRLSFVQNAGSADVAWAQGTADNRPALLASASTFGGLPTMRTFGQPVKLNARDATNAVDRTLAAFFESAAPSAGWISMLVAPSGAAGAEGTVFYSLPQTIGDTSGYFGIAYAGSDQKFKPGLFFETVGAQSPTPQASARSTPVLVSIVRNSTHVQLWLNAAMAAEVAVDAARAIGSVAAAMQWMAGYTADGNTTAPGLYGPMAGGPGAVPDNFADKLAAACSLAGISV